MLYNSPKSVLDSIAKLIADDREQFSKERDALESKLQVEAMKKMKYEYDVPEGIEKEGVAHFIGAASAAHKAGQKKFSFGGKTYPVKIKPHVAHTVTKEEVESKKEKKENEVEENTDTPGNSTHQCAVHVKHEQFGEGKTLFSQHAEPSEDGTIAWYDVMFEHGIEKQIKTSDLNILVSESHGNHKKKMKEDVDLEEGRGRPRKNPVAAKHKDDEDDDYGPDSGPEPDQNIVNHLKKSVDTSGTHDVKFADGSTHKVPSHVAHKVLGAMGKLKPADRLEIQKHINASHKNLMDVHRMIK
jgi:hypothetical protein